MKNISSIYITAVILLLINVVHIGPCYSADSATDPNAPAATESGSEMMTAGAVAAQTVAAEPTVADRILVIRIPIPENNVLLAGIVAGLILVTAVVAFIRHRNNKSSAALPKAPADNSDNDRHADNAAAANRTQPTPAVATAARTDTYAANDVPERNSNPGLHPATLHTAAEASDGASGTTAQTVNNASESPKVRGGEKIAAHTIAAESIVAPEACCSESVVPTAADTASKQTASHVSANNATTTAENMVKISPATQNMAAAINTVDPAAIQTTPAEAAVPDSTTPTDAMLATGTTQEATATPAPSSESVAQQTVSADDDDAPHVDISTSAGDRELGQRLDDFVARHMHNVDLSVDDIADAMYMSRSTLFRSMKRIYGVNPNEYLRQRRLSYAADLLQQNKYTISDICLLVGFNSPSYFSSCFKKQYNVLPKDYRGRQ